MMCNTLFHRCYSVYTLCISFRHHCNNQHKIKIKWIYESTSKQIGDMIFYVTSRGLQKDICNVEYNSNTSNSEDMISGPNDIAGSYSRSQNNAAGVSADEDA